MKICPRCGKVVSYNSYFGAYICTDCNWEDATIGQRRNMGLSVSGKILTRKPLAKSDGKALNNRALFAK